MPVDDDGVMKVKKVGCIKFEAIKATAAVADKNIEIGTPILKVTAETSGVTQMQLAKVLKKLLKRSLILAQSDLVELV